MHPQQFRQEVVHGFGLVLLQGALGLLSLTLDDLVLDELTHVVGAAVGEEGEDPRKEVVEFVVDADTREIDEVRMQGGDHPVLVAPAVEEAESFAQLEYIYVRLSRLFDPLIAFLLSVLGEKLKEMTNIP